MSCPQSTDYPSLSTTDKVDDLYFIALADCGPLEGVFLDDDEVVLDGDAPRIDVERGEQSGDTHGRRNLMRIAVQLDDHCSIHSIREISGFRRQHRRRVRRKARNHSTTGGASGNRVAGWLAAFT